MWRQTYMCTYPLFHGGACRADPLRQMRAGPSPQPLHDRGSALGAGTSLRGGIDGVRAGPYLAFSQRPPLALARRAL